MDRIDAMRAFVAVADEASFTRAGRRLGLSTKMVSKLIARLETDLEVLLFNRTTRRVALTDLGETYLSRCRPLLEQFDDLGEALQHGRKRLAGMIRMTAPTSFGSLHVSPAIAPFLERHPDIEIDLVLSDRRVSLIEDGFDLAVRIGDLRDSSLMAKKLGSMPLLVAASPKYLTTFGKPEHPSALATHRCIIDENHDDPFTWRFAKGGQDYSVRVSSNVRTNAPHAVASLIEAEFGIGRCPAYVLKDGLSAGRIEALFEDYERPEFGIYAVYPPNRHLTARVRALIDHLDEDGFAKSFAM